MHKQTFLYSFDAQTIQCEVIFKPKNRHLYMRIKDEQRVEIRTPPSVSLDEVKQFIADKRGWITTQLAQKAAQKTKQCYTPYSYGSAKQIRLFNKTYDLTMHENSACVEVSLLTTTCHVYAATLQACFAALDAYIKAQLAAYIAARIEHYSASMQLYATAVEIKRVKSYWGRCNCHNALAFNVALAAAAPAVIDYVIVHELAHIRYKNHSKKFWSLVETTLPDAKSARKLLRTL